jgi:hypothetical protein
MSNISVKFALALIVVFASLGASFARHAGLEAARHMPTTIGFSGLRKCFQGNRATAAERKRAEFVHSDGVCWAPQNTNDDPGV